ncbi:hypothetical protein J3B02_003627 [Coemansia erecta]|uniref:MAGE domain-containing protein n=1 Tax=Coemansia asiatica TaxID=1052880 RepID=A0A9W7XG86_9FUNG|nr:hypothetical protein LPJ64_005944 [Coemansia asiatica]KAJ2850825.1 hypothetical protein J3B02_003627 [Coemansia erecta]KAJ2886339.1 hypothetical protein FB639_001590 [Coemansia asiatica]
MVQEAVDLASISQGDVSRELERAAIKLVRYALACQAAKKPMRREVIRDLVKTDSGAGKLSNVFTHANYLLSKDFGLEIVSLPVHEKQLVYRDNAQNTQQQTSSKSSTVNKWVLQSVLPDNARALLEVEQGKDEREIAGFAATVLSLIFVNNMSMPADQLLLYVRKLGPPECIHSPEGSGNMRSSRLSESQLESAAREAISYLVNLGYLDKVSSSTSGATNGSAMETQATQRANDAGDGDTGMEYVWGPAAKTKFQPMDMARFIAAITGQECTAEFVKTISRAYGNRIE